MCYRKPGPRCSRHAAESLSKAIKRYERKPTLKNKERVEELRLEYETTPAGQKMLQDLIEREDIAHDQKIHLSMRLAIGRLKRQDSLDMYSQRYGAKKARLIEEDQAERYAQDALFKKPTTVTTGNADWTHTWEVRSPKNLMATCQCGEAIPFNRNEMPWTSVCEKCGASFDELYFAMPVASKQVGSDAVKFFDKKETVRTTWYHATRNPNWMDDVVEAGVMVHLGSNDAAKDRVGHLMDEYLDVEGVFMYEVSIDGDANVADAVYPDMNDLWRHKIQDEVNDDSVFKTSDGEVPMSVFLREMYDPNVDVVRYVNHYESASSVSLLINPRALKVVKVTKVV